MRQRQPSHYSKGNHGVHKRHNHRCTTPNLRSSSHAKIPRSNPAAKPPTTTTTTTTTATTTTTTTTTSNLETDPAIATSSQAVAAKLRELQRLSHDLTTLGTKYEPIVLRTPLELTDGARVKPGAAQNRTYLEYEDLVLRKLTELDAVASEGSDVVRMRRKELVNKCQEMLGVLDQYRVRQMEKINKETAEEEKNGATPSEMVEFSENATGFEQEEPETAIDESPTTSESSEEMESICSDAEELEDETEDEGYDDQWDQDEGYYKPYCYVPRPPSHHWSTSPNHHYRRGKPIYPTRVRDSFFPRPRGRSFSAWDQWPRSAFGGLPIHYFF